MTEERSFTAREFYHSTAFIVALTATAGSLWFSEGLGLVPCELCWFQRISMYPLVVILGVGILEGRDELHRTVLPLSGIGTLIAGYHSYVQVSKASCSFTGPCAAVQWTMPATGWTIPNLSLLAFSIITLLVGIRALR